jgi:uncharacterized protein (DUF2235 family)
VTEPVQLHPSEVVGLSPTASETVKPERRADSSPPISNAKRIIAFSDGTGNSSGKLFRTNVYRLYSALRLGDVTMAKPQVAYYDNGVGTSSIRLFAILGGIFGFGLKRNLAELYRYVCRNYNPGDEIHAFGFSRGAFTIRLLVALVCEAGIMPYRDERELNRNCADALRRFLGHNRPDRFPGLFIVVRGARDLMIHGWRKLRGQAFNAQAIHRPDVEFVGVWDTVAAYGGPISEVTRGIDQYVWPLTMTDYMLNPKVKTARHALALDEERDSFWPLLWDEMAEKRRVEALPAAEQAALALAPRLKQVWFCGMHSDVGGGYPDDSLAYVSLDWMLHEIGDRLEFIPSEKLRIIDFANPLGPMHDSRSGAAAYYRYQPRKISAMLHPRAGDSVTLNQTRVLRDPTIGEKTHRPQGLLLRCLIHRSVVERIAVGNDNYAPIVLPETFEIDALQPAHDADVCTAIAHAEDPAIAATRVEVQENHWDLVWVRRVGYFLVVAVSLLLVVAPLRKGPMLVATPHHFWLNWLDGLFGWVGGFVPGFLSPWYAALTRDWAETLVILLVLFAMSQVMVGLEATLRDRMRVLWWDAVDGIAAQVPPPTRLRRFRNSYGYQRSLQFWKWDLMPALTGIGILVGAVYTLAVVAVQGELYYEETAGTFCSGTRTASGDLLDAAQTCLKLDRPAEAEAGGAPSEVLVQKGQRYFVFLKAVPGALQPWQDGKHIAVPPRGISTFRLDWPKIAVMAPFAGFRRVGTARWLEPVVEIRGNREDGRFHYGHATLQRLAFADDAACAAQPDVLAVGSFEAQATGPLFIFVNDVALPGFAPDHFYDGNATTRNHGQARVAVYAADQIPEAEQACTGDTRR